MVFEGTLYDEFDQDDLTSIFTSLYKSADRHIAKVEETPDLCIQQFDTWFRTILDALVDSAHHAVSITDREKLNEYLNSSPYNKRSCAIVHGLTRTPKRRSDFVNMCINAVPTCTKRAYGQSEWRQSTAESATPIEDHAGDIGTYGIFLDDDYYSGQTMRKLSIRVGEHMKNFQNTWAYLASRYTSVPYLYQRGHRLDQDLITAFVTSVLTKYRNDFFLRAVMMTILEAAWVVYFDSMEVDIYDGSDVVSWIREKGCNRAFPTKQGVGIPIWANKEKQILFDVDKDPANAGTNHQEKIDVCFGILQKHGYERTKAAIKIKRMRLGLQTEKDTEFAGNVSAAEMFEDTMLIRDEMVDLPRGVQVDRYKDALSNLGYDITPARARLDMEELFPRGKNIKVPERQFTSAEKQHGRVIAEQHAGSKTTLNAMGEQLAAWIRDQGSEPISSKRCAIFFQQEVKTNKVVKRPWAAEEDSALKELINQNEGKKLAQLYTQAETELASLRDDSSSGRTQRAVIAQLERLKKGIDKENADPNGEGSDVVKGAKRFKKK
ncbi:hypothetical protein LTS08_000678 [Lithohypha guttulata]|nr:hypothetical protein LTS08_000678 [Lithohypha guttulata]